MANAAPTPPQFIRHHTTAGERWDLLAWKYYGDATLYAPIIAANWPRIMAGLLSVDAVFNAGVIIGVPILVVKRGGYGGLAALETLTLGGRTGAKQRCLRRAHSERSERSK